MASEAKAHIPAVPGLRRGKMNKVTGPTSAEFTVEGYYGTDEPKQFKLDASLCAVTSDGHAVNSPLVPKDGAQAFVENWYKTHDGDHLRGTAGAQFPLYCSFFPSTDGKMLVWLMEYGVQTAKTINQEMIDAGVAEPYTP